MTLTNARLCAVGLFVALLISACGVDNTLSGAKAAYVAQVDPICAELQAGFGTLGEDPGRQAGEVEEAVNRIKGVSRPSDDRSRADLYIAAMENVYLSLQDIHQSRLVNDEPRAQRALEGAQFNNERAAAAARSYGMVVCGREL